MISLFASIIIICYLILVLIFWLGWERSPSLDYGEQEDLNVSIIIAVRDESENISNLLSDLSDQSYPLNLLEIIIVDDHSSDQTVEIIKEFASRSSLNIKLLALRKVTGKKAALSLAIDRASSNYILTTDGDCRAPSSWVASMITCFATKEIQFVSGPVKLNPQHTFFQRLQSIEFSSLIGSGAATMRLGWPTMANAANLGFKKNAFLEVGGHDGNSASSGDDVFLLHKIDKHFKDSVIFNKDVKAIVECEPSLNLVSFFDQRKRWASKWQYYKDLPTQILALFIFLVNLATLLLPILIFSNLISWLLAVNLLIAKMVFEFLFLREVQKFFNSKFLLHEFLILAIIYPVYVTFMAITGQLGKYNWKGRRSQ